MAQERHCCKLNKMYLFNDATDIFSYHRNILFSNKTHGMQDMWVWKTNQTCAQLWQMFNLVQFMKTYNNY